MQENYYALMVAIFSKSYVTVEQAFSLIQTGKKIHVPEWEKVEMSKEMAALRDSGLTYQEIGDMYGLGKDDVFRRVKRAKMKYRRGEQWIEKHPDIL